LFRYLNYFDYAVIVFYFTVLIGLGLYLKKRASANLEAYFLGGRQMPWWMLGISGMSAWFDMTGTMIITSFLFMLGPRGLFIEFRGGTGLILIFLMLWLGKWHRRSGCITGAEWMIFRFGSGTGGNFARISSAVATLIAVVGTLAYSFVGTGLFLSMFLPFPPWICTLVLISVTLFYTLEAGFYGVVVTDIFQSIFVWAGVLFVAAVAFPKVHGVDMAALAMQVTGNKDWTTSFPQWHTTMPRGYESYSALTVVCTFYLVKIFVQGMGGGADPRYFGARSDRECGLLSFMCGSLMSLRWVMMGGFVVLGLFLVKELFPDQAVLAQ
jgi:solute:Na+ symporter, SSS family